MQPMKLKKKKTKRKRRKKTRKRRKRKKFYKDGRKWKARCQHRRESPSKPLGDAAAANAIVLSV